MLDHTSILYEPVTLLGNIYSTPQIDFLQDDSCKVTAVIISKQIILRVDNTSDYKPEHSNTKKKTLHEHIQKYNFIFHTTSFAVARKYFNKGDRIGIDGWIIERDCLKLPYGVIAEKLHLLTSEDKLHTHLYDIYPEKNDMHDMFNEIPKEFIEMLKDKEFMDHAINAGLVDKEIQDILKDKEFMEILSSTNEIRKEF